MQPQMQPQVQEEVRVQLRGVVAAVRRHEDPDEMEKEVQGVLRTVLEAQMRLEETAQARFAAAMQAHAHHQKAAEDAQRRIEQLEKEESSENSENKERGEKGENREDEREKAQEMLEKAREEEEKAKAALRKAVENRMDFERTEGLEDENEYILRRVLGGKRTVYEETTEDEMKEMQERALAHHLAKRGVDYAAVKRRLRDGTATDADKAVEEWTRDNRRKAHWPRNALHAVREMDAERDERDKKEESEKSETKEKEEKEQ